MMGAERQKLPDLAAAVRKYGAYIFLLMGLIWAILAFLGGSSLLLWPTLTSLASGAFLIVKPKHKFTSALSKASALYGLLLAAYQAYVAIPLIGTLFTTIAAYSVASFSLIAIGNLALLYAGPSKGKTED
jgi:hypothetical protein